MTKLIFVDVDGVLNPTHPTPEHKRYEISVKGIPFGVYLNPVNADWLIKLAHRTDAQLVWATYWENHAPEYLTPLLGLPTDMPIVKMLHTGKWSATVGAEKAYSVSQYLETVECDRFVYFDDEYDIGINLHESNGWHIWVDPTDGLTAKHVQLAEDYLLA